MSALADALGDAGIAVELVGEADTRVTGATHDSRAVATGDLFVCLRGAAFDGHDFASLAVDAGASALLVDHRLDGAGAAQLVVGDTRVAAGVAAAAAHGRPSDALTTIGVTGTNGKTTVTELLAEALERHGETVGRIGTLHGARTTPEATDLQARFAEFRESGHTAVAMEVSSHALALHRVDGTRFDVVGFTNLGHDHLDLHGTVEEYFRAKARLFDGTFSTTAVIDVDDVHGSLLAAEAAGRADMAVVEVTRRALSDIVVGGDRHAYTWRGQPVEVTIGGDFNVDNSHLVLEILVALGIDPADAASAMRGDVTVPGRFEAVEHPAADEREITVIVDYAHTPDGLEQLFASCRAILDSAGRGRLIAVYGCGGERDREKRPVMAAVGAAACDVVILTSDNPRREEPGDIIDDMWEGVGEEYRRRVRSTVDRREAIDDALHEARPGDLVVIAGRGHEPVQDLGDRRVEFDDRQVARTLLSLLETST